MKNTLIRFLQFSFVLFPVVLTSLSVAHAQSIQGNVSHAVIYELNVGISGEVKLVHVVEGDHVTSGDILLELDNTHLAMQVEAAAAQFELNQAQMEEIQRAYERDKELYESGSLSTVDLELSNIARLQSNSILKQSRAKLETQRFRLRQSVITAPENGIVLKRYVHPGERILTENQPTPAFLFAGEHKVIKAEVSMTEPRSLATGDQVNITYLDQSLEGTISILDPITEPGKIHLTIGTTGPLPEIGQPVDITF